MNTIEEELLKDMNKTLQELIVRVEELEERVRAIETRKK